MAASVAISAVNYTYDLSGRLETVTTGTDTFTYGYTANSNLLASLSAPQHSVAYTYESNRNVMTNIDNKLTGATTPLSSYAYSYDALGRRADREQSGSAFTQTNKDTFGYNPRSEVTGSTNDVQTAAEYAPSYSYDQIGNRLTASGGTLSSASATYATNSLNQYADIQVSSLSSQPSHDLDGNLTSDGGTWTYTWNNENRLKSATNGTVTIDFAYDYQGRLVSKEVSVWDVSSSLWSPTSSLRYLYDGWNRIATFDSQVSSLSLQASYLFGLDLSGSMQGAGGVGGLLKEGAYYPTYDANGNVMQKLDGTGATVMNVDYDPFGNIISGQLVGEYGFSTKPLIDGLDWYYYGFRFYDASTGRWLSRDPIGEQGGLNLYGFVFNEPVDWIDDNGLLPIRSYKQLAEQRQEDAQERFNKWYEEESLRNKAWIDEIKNEGKECPKKIDIPSEGCPVSPDEDLWEKPDSIEDSLKGRVITSKYHPGGVYEMRSTPTANGHGNQCVYDSDGNLIEGDDAAAGSADFVAPAGKYSEGHITHDVDPFIDANLGDTGGKYPQPGPMTPNVKRYYELRPQI